MVSNFYFFFDTIYFCIQACAQALIYYSKELFVVLFNEAKL